MPWGTIGSLFPTENWQFLAPPISSQSLFRLSQSWNIRPFGRLWLAQSFGADLELFTVKRVYVAADKNLYQLLLPESFSNLSITSRRIGLKAEYTYSEANWEVLIEAYSYSETDTI